MPAPPSTIDAGSGQSTTYSSATANGLLTDNASVITLASSHRRRSFDTDASVRALAPRSLWGGSRESLPLSILSQNLERSERASLYGRALETASLQAVNMGSPPLGSPNRESFLANRKSGAWGELGESSNYSAGYGNGSLYDREDGRSVRSGVGSVRGSLRSRRSRGGLMEEVGSEVKEEEGDVGDGTMVVKDGEK
ncbi:hypothetical protein BJ508DRAFT_362838 [Ascobolus immersus RN42]|uniref:Uncharacterized protein n=1 Tax=Ascobolus immersus RN42 TaxID=1160509 RepID=A0A3N4IDY3_ASCIM|nr:hypothetical protein BJ508DRAFT_362838 [Ascobolus immersus RN42]